MRLVAARSEVAALGAVPRGFHSPPLALGRAMALVSSSLLFKSYYSTFLGLVNAGTAMIPEKMWKPAGKKPRRLWTARASLFVSDRQPTLLRSLRRGAVSSSRHSTSSGMRSL